MKYKYFACLLLFALCHSCTITDDKNKDPVKDAVTEETKAFDSMSTQEKIDLLKEKKMKYESKAINAENQAQRIQFQEGQLQEAKRLWQEAEINRQISNELQKKIDELEKLKGK